MASGDYIGGSMGGSRNLLSSSVSSGKTVDDAVNTAAKVKNAGLSNELKKVPLKNTKLGSSTQTGK